MLKGVKNVSIMGVLNEKRCKSLKLFLSKHKLYSMILERNFSKKNAYKGKFFKL